MTQPPMSGLSGLVNFTDDLQEADTGLDRIALLRQMQQQPIQQPLIQRELGGDIPNMKDIQLEESLPGLEAMEQIRMLAMLSLAEDDYINEEPINPEEVREPVEIINQYAASGGLVGLPVIQAGFGGFIKKIFKAPARIVKGAAKAIKKVARSPIGRIAIPLAAGYFAPHLFAAGGFGGMPVWAARAIGTGLGSKLTGADTKQALLSAGLAGIGSGIMEGGQTVGQWDAAREAAKLAAAGTTVKTSADAATSAKLTDISKAKVPPGAYNSSKYGLQVTGTGGAETAGLAPDAAAHFGTNVNDPNAFTGGLRITDAPTVNTAAVTQGPTLGTSSPDNFRAGLRIEKAPEIVVDAGGSANIPGYDSRQFGITGGGNVEVVKPYAELSPTEARLRAEALKHVPKTPITDTGGLSFLDKPKELLLAGYDKFKALPTWAKVAGGLGATELLTSGIGMGNEVPGTGMTIGDFNTAGIDVNLDGPIATYINRATGQPMSLSEAMSMIRDIGSGVTSESAYAQATTPSDVDRSLLGYDMRFTESGGLIGMAYGGSMPEFSGQVTGQGHGMEDNVYMPIVDREQGQQVATLAVSPKEYVVDANTMSLLGNGNPDEGAKVMDQTIKDIRIAATGQPNQQQEIDGLEALNRMRSV